MSITSRSDVADQLLTTVTNTLDTLVTAAQPHGGFIPSTIDIASHEMITDPQPAIEGQRENDRAIAGSNLIHDESLLLTFKCLGKALDRTEYNELVSNYFDRFARDCTDTASGLFPWGEHMYWGLLTNVAMNSYELREDMRGRKTLTHDHLRAAPQWLWDELWQRNPTCVERFADGLQFHWNEGEPRTYIRHARMDAREPAERAKQGVCDFPRHGGFYIYDLSYALSKGGDRKLLPRIDEFVEYWWTKKGEFDCLAIDSNPGKPDKIDVLAPGQTLSLATSLLESAPLVEPFDADMAGRMRQYGKTYIEGFLNAPHRPEADEFLITFGVRGNDFRNPMPIWGSRYGVWPLGYVAVNACLAYHLTGDDRLLRWAREAGRCLTQTPFETTKPVPSMDAGLGLGLLCELYSITGEDHWLDNALEVANKMVDIYIENNLIRGASGIDWYESQMGPGFLLHALARTALLAKHGKACPLEADYTAR